jgi:NTE family protein
MDDNNKHRSVSLVLGSGGARGLAHIGIIHELEENGYRIESIAGCSMGALIGGIHAAGQLRAFESWVKEITKVDIVSLLDLAWQSDGLVKGDKIINTLVDLVGDVQIEELPIPYTAVAADIVSGTEVWLTSGRLFDAIRASISLPLFFTPVPYRDGQLIDGGVLNPVPIAPTFADDTDMTIAVNLGGPPVDTLEDISEQSERSTASTEASRWVEGLVADVKRSIKERTARDWSAYDVANQAFDAMQSAIARQKLAAYPPDYEIEISRNACGTLEFHRADEMIELGRRVAREQLFRKFRR